MSAHGNNEVGGPNTAQRLPPRLPALTRATNMEALQAATSTDPGVPVCPSDSPENLHIKNGPTPGTLGAQPPALSTSTPAAAPSPPTEASSQPTRPRIWSSGTSKRIRTKTTSLAAFSNSTDTQVRRGSRRLTRRVAPGSEPNDAATSHTGATKPPSVTVGEGFGTESEDVDSDGRDSRGVSVKGGSAVRYGHGTAVRRAHRLAFNTRNAYYLLIELSWSSLILLALTLYLASAVVFACVLLPLADDLISADAETDFAPFEKCLYCSFASLISLGYADLVPTTSAAVAICTIEQFYALMLGAVVVSLILSKFQHPLEDLLFSSRLLCTTRDYRPVLLLRIGNLRCNRIYLPEVRVTHAEPTVTDEGEPFIRFTSLAVDFTPPSIAGTVTLAVDLTTPGIPKDLRQIATSLAAGDPPGRLAAGTAITVVLRGWDSVLGNDITAFHRYGADEVVCGPYQFGDVMDPRGRVDFQRFHQLAPHPLREAMDRRPDLSAPAVVHVLNGAVPYRGVLVKSCMYSQKVEMLLMLGEVPFSVVPINFKRKPRWFFEYAPDGTTPVVVHNGQCITGSATIIDWILSTYPSHFSHLPPANAASAARAAATAVTVAMEGWIRLEPETAAYSEAEAEFAQALAAFAAALGGRPFLCGEACGVEDAILFPQVESAIEYLELLFEFELGAVAPAVAAWRDQMYNTQSWRKICPPIELLKRLRCERLCGKMADKCPWLLKKIRLGGRGGGDPGAEVDEGYGGVSGPRVELCM